MRHETFNNLVEARIDDCVETLGVKNKEYSSDSDRLHNFKKAGRMKGQDPIQALDGMWLKHRVSMDDIIEQMIADPTYLPPRELVKEKVTDNVNYNILLEALIEDRRELMSGKMVKTGG
jgi:hypothetical protein